MKGVLVIRSRVRKSEVNGTYSHVLFFILISISFLAVLSPFVCANQIELAGEGFIPDPNQEITVWVQSDVPLFCMGIGVEVAGDATITSAMCEADCNDFGWNNGWNSDPYIDPEGWVFISGVSWPGEAIGTIGYVTFQYLSGQVDVSIFYCDAFDPNCQTVPYSDAILVFGQADPNTQLLEENAQVGFQEGASIDDEQTLMQQTESFEELSNPLGSRILESKTYRITSLPLEIEGHVVIPAGAKLIAPYDPNNNIIEVMPGGLLDMGKAVNISDPNFPDVLPPVEILPEDPNFYFTHNNTGIYVHRGANPCTRIYNTVITHCRIGIVVNEVLTNPIQNVITFGCYDGIYIFAPNAIADCEFWYYGTVYEELYEYAGAGLYINLDDRNYPYPDVKVNRVVTYSGDVGIYLEGANPDPNLADPNQVVPKLEVVNSCLALSYFYGIYKTQDAAGIDVTCCAFGGNEYDVNFDASFTGCIGLEYDPFYTIGEEKKLYIAPWSEMIDAGYGMAEDGTGTCLDRPDIGQMDIGCHFPIDVTGSFGIPSSPADFNWDGIVDELDLEWVDWCMGATGDPNIVQFDTNYDSQINMPDFGLMSFDYGYSNDANLPGNHDPNCERSDFNDDHKVDLEDVGILAEHWLTMVFDPYRICSLCNLYRNPDPNEPEIDAIIDSRDYDTFMAEWGKVSYSGCAISFRKEPNQILEPNDLSEGITIFPEGFPPSTISIFTQIDGRSAGLSYPGFDEQSSIAIPTDEYGNGWHTLTVGGYTMDGGCWVENVKVRFQNSLYFTSVQSVYEPNEPLYFSAFNDDPGNVSIQTTGFDDTCVWSNTYSGNCISGFIPAAITAQNEVAFVTVQNASAQVQSQTRKRLHLAKSDPDTRALLILPDLAIRNADRNLILQIQNAFNFKGIKYFKLELEDARWANVNWFAQNNKNRTIKYMFIDAHGDYKFGNVLRTHVELADGLVFSMRKSNFYPQAPSWCIELPGDWEKRVKSFLSMNFTSLEFVYFATCYSGRLTFDEGDQLVEGSPGQFGLVTDGPYSDMTLALHLDDISKSRIYHGWYDKDMIAPSDYAKWTQDVWQRLGEGDDLNEALIYAINHQTDLSNPTAPVNNYRLKGQGLFTDIRLNSN